MHFRKAISHAPHSAHKNRPESPITGSIPLFDSEAVFAFDCNLARLCPLQLQETLVTCACAYHTVSGGCFILSATYARSRFSLTTMANERQPSCLEAVRESQPKGKTVELGVLTTYVTGLEHPDGTAILLIAEVSGFSTHNSRHVCLYRCDCAAYMCNN